MRKSDYDEDGDKKDGPGCGGRKDDSDSATRGGGGGGGGYHRIVLLLDARTSPFLRLDRPKIRQAYRVYVVNNYNVLNPEPKSRVFQLF